MPMICYEPTRFRKGTLALIQVANEILTDLQSDGLSVSLRQLYYQLVSRNLIPNKQAEYKRLGATVSKARRAGLIDWDAIVDRGRFLRGLNDWENPGEIIAAGSHSFRVDRWRNQDVYVECWFEKDALLGVFERAANEWRVPFFSCRGYTSDSEVWGAAQRMIAQEKPTVVLHFGDHDPSGLDMTRDITDRLALFGALDVDVRRLALNMDQVTQYKPPPNPAKESDARFRTYAARYGTKSWELDALSPRVLATLVKNAVKDVMDKDLWDASQAREDRGRLELAMMAKQYKQLVTHAVTKKWIPKEDAA